MKIPYVLTPYFRRSLRFFGYCLASNFVHYAPTVSPHLSSIFFRPHRLAPSSFSRASRSSIFARGRSVGFSFLHSYVEACFRPHNTLPRDFGIAVRAHYREAKSDLSLATYLHLVDVVFAGIDRSTAKSASDATPRADLFSREMPRRGRFPREIPRFSLIASEEKLVCWYFRIPIFFLILDQLSFNYLFAERKKED